MVNLRHSYNRTPEPNRRLIGHSQGHRDEHPTVPYQPQPVDRSYPLVQYATNPKIDGYDGRPIEDPVLPVPSALSPESANRRGQAVKVKLFKGKFGLDFPVPNKLLEELRLKSEREFTHMRFALNSPV